MRFFKDNEGTEWEITVNVGALKRIRRTVPEFDATDAVTGALAKRMAEDPVLFADVLAAVLEPQLRAREVTVEAFFERLGGDGLGAAQVVFLEELIDFFPNAEMRSALRKQHALLSPLIHRKFNRLIETMSTSEYQSSLEKFVDALFSNPVTSSPELSECGRTNTPAGSSIG